MGAATSIAADATDADSGVARVEFYADGAPIGTDSAAPYAVTWDSSTASLGAHTIMAKAFDSAGNYAATAVVVYAVGADKTPPTVTLTSPADGATVSGAVPVAATATDAETGVSRVEFSVDGAVTNTDSNAPYSWTWDASAVVPGPHTVTATAYDAAGNAGSSSAHVTVVAAGTATGPASWSGASPGANGSVTALRPPISVKVADAAGILGSPYYSLKVDGLAQTPAVAWGAADHTSATLSFTPRADLAFGTHNVKFTVRNNAGVYSTYSWSFEVISASDVNPPTVSLTSPGSGATVSGLVPVAANAADAESGIARVELCVDGAVIAAPTSAPYSATWDASAVTPGAHSVSAVAYDKAGNTASASVTVMVVAPDVTAPAVAITAPAEGASVTGNVSLAADATDNESGVARVEFRVDGALVGNCAAAPYTASWNTSLATIGDHTITATAFDRAGNSSSATIRVTVPDVTPPAVTIASPASGAVVYGTVSISALASDAGSGIDRVDFAVDGTPVGSAASAPYTVTWDTSTVAEGTHLITATAYDKAGNQGTATIPVTVPAADVTPPTVAITSPSEGASLAPGAIALGATASDVGLGVDRVEFQVDGTPVGTSATAPYGAVWNAGTATLGSHTITVVAYDKAGNSSATSVSVTLVAAGASIGPALWSSVTPAHMSTVAVPRPTISATAYDPAGLLGSPYYSLKVDGVAQTPSVTWLDPGHTRATLSFVPRADLTPGTHTVKYTVKNTAGPYSTFTWSFTYAP